MYIAIKNNQINTISSNPLINMGDIVVLDDVTEVMQKMQYFKIQEYTDHSIIFSDEFIEGEEINYINDILKNALPRYNELKELGEMRSNTEEQEFQKMELEKVELMKKRKTLKE